MKIEHVPHAPFGASHDTLSAHTFYSTVYKPVCHNHTEYMNFAAAYADWYLQKIAKIYVSDEVESE